MANEPPTITQISEARRGLRLSIDALIAVLLPIIRRQSRRQQPQVCDALVLFDAAIRSLIAADDRYIGALHSVIGGDLIAMRAVDERVRDEAVSRDG